LLLCTGVVVAGLALFASTSAGHRILGLGTTSSAAVASSPSPAAPLRVAALYGAQDPWRQYLASEETCPGGTRTDLPMQVQMQVMLCLIDYARRQRGLSQPTQTTLLSSTALQKANEIVRCQNFAHAPCGGSPDDDVRATGFEGAFGENLYVAEGPYGAPRVALDGWLNSREHRENLFRPEWTTQGIAALKLPAFLAYHDATLWVSHFATS
jgi:uncharacterized protein YkwD